MMSDWSRIRQKHSARIEKVKSIPMYVSDSRGAGNSCTNMFTVNCLVIQLV